MTDQLAVGIKSAQDAIALVRAALADDSEEASRLLAETPSVWVLASNLACMVAASVSRLPEPLLERWLEAALRKLQDEALDLDFTPHSEIDAAGACDQQQDEPLSEAAASRARTAKHKVGQVT